MKQKVKIPKFHPLAWLRPCLPQHHVPPGKVWAQTSKTVCRMRCSSAALGLLMWNPIVSGSTDLWQHVWMYYSKAAEVRPAGGWTQDYRQAALYILKKESEHMAFKVAKKQKYTDGKNNNSFFFLLFSVVAHYATDWNLDSIHRAEPWLGVKAAKKKKNRNQRWCLTPAGSCLLYEFPSQRLYTFSALYFLFFIAVMFIQLPGEVGHPLRLHPSVPDLHHKKGKGGNGGGSFLRYKACC